MARSPAADAPGPRARVRPRHGVAATSGEREPEADFGRWRGALDEDEDAEGCGGAPAAALAAACAHDGGAARGAPYARADEGPR